MKVKELLDETFEVPEDHHDYDVVVVMDSKLEEYQGIWKIEWNHNDKKLVLSVEY